MLFNDTAPIIQGISGPPPWLARLAEDATMEAAVLKRPVQGRYSIVALLRHAIPLYEFQHFTYRGEMDGFFMESYRSRVRGVPIECSVLVHFNPAGEADSLLINHRPLGAALLFSRLMGEQVGDRYGEGLFLTAADIALPLPNADA